MNRLHAFGSFLPFCAHLDFECQALANLRPTKTGFKSLDVHENFLPAK